MVELLRWLTRTSRCRYPKRTSGRRGSWPRAVVPRCRSSWPVCCAKPSSVRRDMTPRENAAWLCCRRVRISALAAAPRGPGKSFMSVNLQFVDTNVLVYAHDVTSGDKHSRARALVEELWDTRQVCLSVQVLQEFFVTTTRKIPKPLEALAAAQIIDDLAHWH